MRKGRNLNSTMPAWIPCMLWVMACCFLALPSSSWAESSVCARVKIEIQQELTLERQAFDAHIRINNGLDGIGIENVGVEVTFLDADGRTVRATTDPHDESALFFFRLNSMENIGAVDGTGTVGPASSADIHWLIIPAPGASKGQAQGTLYYVGASLSYTLGGDEHTIEVTPDYIFVKPMPEMALDYFIPTDVHGDDAFTPEVEPPVPFSLGLRVTNNGYGTAAGLKIDSAQPRIVENEQGLLIDFIIQGTEVNGQETVTSLLADFGDIAPSGSGVARWIMTCSLSGRFVEFTAEFSHADELGGEVTSLMDSVTTHFLVRDVLVDLPGRDTVRDFLAKDGGVFRVYESQGLDTPAVDQSASSSLALDSQTAIEASYTLTCPVTAGVMFVKLPDPSRGSKNIKEIIRSDGKRIKPENFWISKTREEDHTWSAFFNLFDVNSTHSYTVTFIDPDAQGHPPVLSPVADQKGVEGAVLSFTVSATDPDGSTPSLSGSPIPALASFVDLGDGTGLFSWTPAAGQAGTYNITFKATDGKLDSFERVVVTVCPATDSDCDGMADEWERHYFGTLDRDGTGDADGDGVSDLDEYLNGTDPTVKNVPSVPAISSPEDGGETTDLQPDLVILNSTDPDGDPVTYAFELYADAGLTTLVASNSHIFEGSSLTSWTVPVELSDNTGYTWRVRATDGRGFSEWAYGTFFVNTANDPPGSFTLMSPQDESEVDTVTPVLRTTASTDVDRDPLTYTFEVYADPNLASLVVSKANVTPSPEDTVSWTVNVPLTDNTRFFWRALAVDSHGATTATSLFTFFVNTENDAPGPPAILFPLDGAEVVDRTVDLSCENTIDIDGDHLTYTFELDTVNTFDSPARTVSGPVEEGIDRTTFTVSDLSDNTRYYWRVLASDGVAQSPWVRASFFVNTGNDAPSAPKVKNPGDGAWVPSLTPTLELTPSLDPDGDTLLYEFEIYEGLSFADPISRSESPEPRWVLPFELANDVWYSWKARARDEHGALSDRVSSVFFTDTNGVDDPPDIALATPAEDIHTRGGPVLITWQDNDPDSAAEIDLAYTRDQSAYTPILSGISEDPDGPEDSFLWDTASLAEGSYTVTATIRDLTSSATSTAPGVVIVDRTTPTVQATPPGGSFTTTQTVTLSASEPSVIYFTLDGSAPTTSSAQFEAPLDISQSTTLKFMAVDRAGNSSPIANESYTIQDAVRVRVIGMGFNHLENPRDRALMVVNCQGPLQPRGSLQYHYARTIRGNSRKKLRIDFSSTRISSVMIQGSTAVIEGEGKANHGRGCTFTATVTDGSPDAFGIAIRNPDGSLLFSAAPAPLSKGAFKIKAIKRK